VLGNDLVSSNFRRVWPLYAAWRHRQSSYTEEKQALWRDRNLRCSGGATLAVVAGVMVSSRHGDATRTFPTAARVLKRSPLTLPAATRGADRTAGRHASSAYRSLWWATATGQGAGDAPQGSGARLLDLEVAHLPERLGTAARRRRVGMAIGRLGNAHRRRRRVHRRDMLTLLIRIKDEKRRIGPRSPARAPMVA